MPSSDDPHVFFLQRKPEPPSDDPPPSGNTDSAIEPYSSGCLLTLLQLYFFCFFRIVGKWIVDSHCQWTV